MSGRNWTRRSIEELVEAYLRNKKAPAGGDSYITLATFNFADVANGTSQTRITAGVLSSTYETVNSFRYYPLANPTLSSTRSFICPHDWGSRIANTGGSLSNEKYVNASGCLQASMFQPSCSGTIIYKGTNIGFKMLIVPKFVVLNSSGDINTMIFSAGGVRPVPGGRIHTKTAAITCDINNFMTAGGSGSQYKRTAHATIYTGKNMPDMGTLTKGEVTISGSSNSAVTAIKANGVTPYLGAYADPIWPYYADCGSLTVQTRVTTTPLLDYVKNNYHGYFEYEDGTNPTATRNMNMIALCYFYVDEADITDYTDDDTVNLAYALSRWFLESDGSGGSTDSYPSFRTNLYCPRLKMSDIKFNEVLDYGPYSRKLIEYSKEIIT